MELPELVPTDDAADVVVRLGRVPPQLINPIREGPGYQAALGQCLINVPGVARYWVTDGTAIVVEPCAGAPPGDVRVFLLSSVVAALVQQRGRLSMRATTVVIEGTGVVFAGESGCGKSTLAAACHDLGHQVVTDDLSVVDFDRAGAPVVHRGSRHIHLSADASGAVGTTLGARTSLRNGTTRLRAEIPPERAVDMAPISAIVFFTTRKADTIRTHPVSGRAKVELLLRETSRRRLWTTVGCREKQFTNCAELARQVRVTQVDRPLTLLTVPATLDAITREIRGSR